MSYEPKPGTFTLFKNDRKEADSHPDYKGDGADLDGNPVWVNAWLKKDKNGRTFMSCNLKPKEAPKAKPVPARESPKGKASSADFDSEIPF